MATPSTASGYINQIELDDTQTIYLCYSDDDNGTFQIFKKLVNESVWQEITPFNHDGYISGINAIPGTSTLIFNSGYFGVPEAFTRSVSSDGGATWLEVAANEGLQYGYVQFADANTGYTCEIPRAYELPSTKVFVYNGSPLTGLISQNVIDSKIEIFPNPSSDFLNVKISSETSNDFWILINDGNGKLIDKMVFTNQKTINEIINIKDIPQGEYMLTVANINGATTKQFIKI